MYYTVRIDSDPTSWELTKGIERVPASSTPEVLPVYHPLLGNLVLSSQSVGSAVFLEYRLPSVDGTRPNGMSIPKGGGALYVPSPLGPGANINPPNFYLLASDVSLEALQADIIAAMTHRTSLPVTITGGEVVINGAEVPFVVLCEPHTGGPVS